LVRTTTNKQRRELMFAGLLLSITLIIGSILEPFPQISGVLTRPLHNDVTIHVVGNSLPDITLIGCYLKEVTPGLAFPFTLEVRRSENIFSLVPVETVKRQISEPDCGTLEMRFKLKILELMEPSKEI